MPVWPLENLAGPQEVLQVPGTLLGRGDQRPLRQKMAPGDAIAPNLEGDVNQWPCVCNERVTLCQLDEVLAVTLAKFGRDNPDTVRCEWKHDGYDHFTSSNCACL